MPLKKEQEFEENLDVIFDMGQTIEDDNKRFLDLDLYRKLYDNFYVLGIEVRLMILQKTLQEKTNNKIFLFQTVPYLPNVKGRKALDGRLFAPQNQTFTTYSYIQRI